MILECFIHSPAAVTITDLEHFSKAEWSSFKMCLANRLLLQMIEGDNNIKKVFQCSI